MKTRSIGDGAVRSATGRGWKEWFARLDKAGAAERSHGEIVALVRKIGGAGPWWRQMVTVEYERARGLRKVHETSAGFVANASRTLKAPLADLWRAWATPAGRRRWLPDPSFLVRKATVLKSMRITWVDGETNVEVLFTEKGPEKSQVAVQHSRLKKASDVARSKRYWRMALDDLQKALES